MKRLYIVESIIIACIIFCVSCGSDHNTNKYLYKLYWLAITEISDATNICQNNIYKAILRAEEAKANNSKRCFGNEKR